MNAKRRGGLNETDRLKANGIAAKKASVSRVALASFVVMTKGPTWAREQASPKPSWLVPWEGLSEPDREVDRRIGERLWTMGAGVEARPVVGTLACMAPEQPRTDLGALADAIEANGRTWQRVEPSTLAKALRAVDRRMGTLEAAVNALAASVEQVQAKAGSGEARVVDCEGGVNGPMRVRRPDPQDEGEAGDDCPPSCTNPDPNHRHPALRAKRLADEQRERLHEGDPAAKVGAVLGGVNVVTGGFRADWIGEMPSKVRLNASGTITEEDALTIEHVLREKMIDAKVDRSHDVLTDGTVRLVSEKP